MANYPRSLSEKSKRSPTFERGLVTEESNWYQYRFQDIVEPDSGRILFTLEHEVRSLRSPLYLRPLVNRNPAQRQPTYQRGRDAFVPGMS